MFVLINAKALGQNTETFDAEEFYNEFFCENCEDYDAFGQYRAFKCDFDHIITDKDKLCSEIKVWDERIMERTRMAAKMFLETGHNNWHYEMHMAAAASSDIMHPLNPYAVYLPNSCGYPYWHTLIGDKKDEILANIADYVIFEYSFK